MNWLLSYTPYTSKSRYFEKNNGNAVSAFGWLRLRNSHPQIGPSFPFCNWIMVFSFISHHQHTPLVFSFVYHPQHRHWSFFSLYPTTNTPIGLFLCILPQHTHWPFPLYLTPQHTHWSFPCISTPSICTSRLPASLTPMRWPLPVNRAVFPIYHPTVLYTV